MKYLNGSHGGCISLQKSPCVLFKNQMDSFPIFPGDSLIINFPWEQIEREKSLD